MATTLTTPDLVGAVYDFLVNYFCPPLDAENIFRGWQNYYSLPRETNTFIVYSLGNLRRVGTNLENIVDPGEDEDTGSLTVATLYEVDADLWVSGDTDVMARNLAASIASLVRSDEATRFFAHYGAASALYADDPVTDAIRDEHDAWVPTWRLTLHLSAWFDTTVPVDYFVSVDFNSHQLR